jgi:hypothetical protein
MRAFTLNSCYLWRALNRRTIRFALPAPADP